MDIFKKKSLCAALAGVGALGAVGAANAVNLNPDGLGQVLIYPYYTVRASLVDANVYASLLSVVNSTASAKAIKVRFLEGENSREVLDFNVYLSHNDVWTAAITTTVDGAKMATADKSCTLPPIPSAGVAFRNGAYAGDGGGDTLDRTREGYVEIIEMATYSPTSTTADNITHVPSTGVPKNCAAQTDGLGASEAQAPGGGLFGGISLLNVLTGTDYSEDAVALDRYSVFQLYTPAGVTTPDLTQAQPPVSAVIANNIVYQSNWASGPDPVSAVLMHDQVVNEFVLDSVTKSGTDWVVTMPTKRFYIGTGTGTPPKLFQRNFNKTAGACDDVSLNMFDREEGSLVTLDFSPAPQGNALCWEANVVTFSNSNVLGSKNSANVPATFQNGWLSLGFPVVSGAHLLANAQTTRTTVTIPPVTTGPGAATYFGLPVIGFAVQSFTNGTLSVGGTNVLSNYGGNFVQKGTRLIQ